MLIIICSLNSHLFSQLPKPIGPPGGYVEQIAIHPQFPNIIYSSTIYAGAIFRTVDGGNTVDPLDNQSFSSRLITQIVLPHNEKDYLYVDLFGISIMSRNAGKDWVLILNSNYKPHFTFNPLNSDIMYMTRDNESLWRSNDKGSTWFEVNSFPQILDFVAVAPTDTALIYAVANNSLYKSKNSGKEWIKTFDGSDSIYFSTRKMIVNPQNKNSVYIKSGGCLLKTTDGGKTFNTVVCGNNFTSFALNPIDTSIIYTTFGDRDFVPDGGILKSVDNGETWYSIINGIPEGIVTASTIEINPQNPEELYIGVGGLGVFKTNNGGENWNLTNLSYSSSVYNISISNKNEGEILIQQDGWNIVKTNNNGEYWYVPNYEPEPKILNYILDFDINPDNNNIGLLGGGTSLYKTIDGGNNWYPTNQLPGAVSVKYHKYNPGIIFAQTKDTINNFENYLSTDGGNNWNTTTTIMPSVLNNKVFSNKNDSLLFRFGNEIYKEGLYNNYVYKSLDLGTSWTKCSNGLLRFTEVYWQIKPIWCLALQENTTNILYCGQEG